MAEFQVTFDEYVAPMSYEDHAVEEFPECNSDVQGRDIGFDNGADFSIGHNYTGATPEYVTITGYTDTMEEFEDGVGSVGTPAGFIPSTIQDAANNDLVYPYTLLVSDLSTLQFEHNSLEIVCTGLTKFYTERLRKIEYYIEDINGLTGPLRQSTIFQTTQ